MTTPMTSRQRLQAVLSRNVPDRVPLVDISFWPQTLEMYEQLLRPCHQRIKEWCRRQNIPLLLHCDGDVREFIPLLLEVGFDAIQPLEARCGNDVRELKRLYGNDIVFFGNISTDVMATGSDAEIEEEVATKVAAARRGGGYIYQRCSTGMKRAPFP